MGTLTLAGISGNELTVPHLLSIVALLTQLGMIIASSIKMPKHGGKWIQMSALCLMLVVILMLMILSNQTVRSEETWHLVRAILLSIGFVGIQLTITPIYQWS